MDEYYRKKLLNKIIEDNQKDYENLKKIFNNVNMTKIDRNLKVIDFPLWLLLLRDYWYTVVQTDILESYTVRSTWKGDVEAPFELNVVGNGSCIYSKIYYTEETVLSAQEKIVFLIEQKIFSPINC